MSASLDARLGTQIAGYRVDRLLGRGGMSVVYLAEDVRLGRKVALKLLAPELAEDERFRERFLRESRLAASIDHSNVIPIYEAGESEGLLFIAMRYVEGTDLKELLQKEGQLDPGRAVALAAQVADALDTAHEHGLVHRDVKPANVLIARQGGREHCYLADFGLTKQSASETGLTATEQFVGTPDYVAPELIERNPADGRADEYSLACLLYQCLTGQAPYRGESLMGTLWAHVNDAPPTVTLLRPELPQAVDPVLARGMAKDPDDRYPACHELVEAAGDALGVTTPSSPLAVRKRTVALLVLALALVLIAVAATAGILLTRSDGTKPPVASTKPALAITVDSVQRIDPKTNELVATVRGRQGLVGIAAGEGAVWVVNHQDRKFSKIDPKTNAIVKTASAGGDATEIAAGLGAVWIAFNLGSSLSKVNADTGVVDQTIAVGQGYGAAALAVGEGFVWIGTSTGVWKLDPQVLLPPRTVIPNILPMVMVPGDGAVWAVASDDVSQVVEIDATTNAVERSELRFRAGGAALARGDLWVTDPEADAVVRIDTTTHAIVGRVAVGDGPAGIAAGDGAVWVANYTDGTISKIDAQRKNVVTTIDVGSHPTNIAVGEGGVWVLVHP